MKILDATAGARGIWYQKNHPFVTFMDKRKCDIWDKTENKKFSSTRRIKVNPDIVSEWKDAPFPDNHFDMIIFDPPHLIRKRDWSDSSMCVRYGKLYQDDWKQVLKQGIKKLFDVLKPEGVFILKWCETDKSVDEVISLMPYPPLFGTRTGQANKNHWVLFLKYDVNKKLEI